MFICILTHESIGIVPHLNGSFGKICDVGVAAYCLLPFVHLIAAYVHHSYTEKIVLAHIHIQHTPRPKQYTHPTKHAHPNTMYMSINDHSTTLYVLSAFYLFTIFLFRWWCDCHRFIGTWQKRCESIIINSNKPYARVLYRIKCVNIRCWSMPFHAVRNEFLLCAGCVRVVSGAGREKATRTTWQ